MDLLFEKLSLNGGSFNSELIAVDFDETSGHCIKLRQNTNVDSTSHLMFIPSYMLITYRSLLQSGMPLLLGEEGVRVLSPFCVSSAFFLLLVYTSGTVEQRTALAGRPFAELPCDSWKACFRGLFVPLAASSTHEDVNEEKAEAALSAWARVLPVRVPALLVDPLTTLRGSGHCKDNAPPFLPQHIGKVLMETEKVRHRFALVTSSCPAVSAILGSLCGCSRGQSQSQTDPGAPDCRSGGSSARCIRVVEISPHCSCLRIWSKVESMVYSRGFSVADLGGLNHSSTVTATAFPFTFPFAHVRQEAFDAMKSSASLSRSLVTVTRCSCSSKSDCLASRFDAAGQLQESTPVDSEAIRSKLLAAASEAISLHQKEDVWVHSPGIDLHNTADRCSAAVRKTLVGGVSGIGVFLSSSSSSSEAAAMTLGTVTACEDKEASSSGANVGEITLPYGMYNSFEYALWFGFVLTPNAHRSDQSLGGLLCDVNGDEDGCGAYAAAAMCARDGSHTEVAVKALSLCSECEEMSASCGALFNSLVRARREPSFVDRIQVDLRSSVRLRCTSLLPCGVAWLFRDLMVAVLFYLRAGSETRSTVGRFNGGEINENPVERVSDEFCALVETFQDQLVFGVAVLHWLYSRIPGGCDLKDAYCIGLDTAGSLWLAPEFVTLALLAVSVVLLRVSPAGLSVSQSPSQSQQPVMAEPPTSSFERTDPVSISTVVCATAQFLRRMQAEVCTSENALSENSQQNAAPGTAVLSGQRVKTEEFVGMPVLHILAGDSAVSEVAASVARDMQLPYSMLASFSVRDLVEIICSDVSFAGCRVFSLMREAVNGDVSQCGDQCGPLVEAAELVLQTRRVRS